MVRPRNTFDAETAKAWVGEGGMKQYFKVIPKPKPPKPRGRPPKRKARSTNTPPTEFNSAAPVPAPATRRRRRRRRRSAIHTTIKQITGRGVVDGDDYDYDYDDDDNDDDDNDDNEGSGHDNNDDGTRREGGGARDEREGGATRCARQNVRWGWDKGSEKIFAPNSALKFCIEILQKLTIFQPPPRVSYHIVCSFCRI